MRAAGPPRGRSRCISAFRQAGVAIGRVPCRSRFLPALLRSPCLRTKPQVAGAVGATLQRVQRSRSLGRGEAGLDKLIGLSRGLGCFWSWWQKKKRTHSERWRQLARAQMRPGARSMAGPVGEIHGGDRPMVGAECLFSVAVRLRRPLQLEPLQRRCQQCRR